MTPNFRQMTIQFKQKQLKGQIMTDYTIEQIKKIQEVYQCTFEMAMLYLDLREEGYSRTQALLMAGLTDPAGYESED